MLGRARADLLSCSAKRGMRVCFAVFRVAHELLLYLLSRYSSAGYAFASESDIIADVLPASR